MTGSHLTITKGYIEVHGTKIYIKQRIYQGEDLVRLCDSADWIQPKIIPILFPHYLLQPEPSPHLNPIVSQGPNFGQTLLLLLLLTIWKHLNAKHEKWSVPKISPSYFFERHEVVLQKLEDKNMSSAEVKSIWSNLLFQIRQVII